MKKIKFYLAWYMYSFLFFITHIDRIQKHKNKVRIKIKALNNKKATDCDFQQLSYVENSARIKIIIIGRLKEGDSIGNHTTAFLNEADFSTNDIYVYDEYEKNLYRMKDRWNKRILWHGDICNFDCHDFDILFFLNVMDYGNDDNYIVRNLPKRMPLISYTYSVFEGTIPPKNWVNIINIYFDALIVPIQSLKDIFIKNGCEKPVFVLPVALDLNKHFSLEQLKSSDVFSFGFSGTLDPRKNPLKIIQAFEKAFSKDEPVRLLLHSRYKNKSAYAQEFMKELTQSNDDRIIFTNEMFSDEEHLAWLKNIDAYVFPSQGEGYSVTPREALACGKIVILSDIPAHKDITSLGCQEGIYFCHADIERPSIHTSLNNQICGIMYDTDINEIAKKMHIAYEERKQMLSQKMVEKRKNCVRPFTIENLKNSYSAVMNPKKIEFSDIDEIDNYTIKVSSNDFLKKINMLLLNKQLKIIVDPVNDAGFFSLFNKYVSHLAYADENEIVIPDWRSKRLKINKLFKTGTSNFQHFCYGKEEDGNIFLKFFKPPYDLNLIPEYIYQTDLMYFYANEVKEINDYNAYKEPNLTYINSYKLYEDEKYFPIFRKKYNAIVNAHIQLNDALSKKIENFYNENMNGFFTICAHLRCQSHVLELLEEYPSFELYAKTIRRILAKNNINETSEFWRLFVATDNDDALLYLKQQFPRNIVYQTDIQRLTSEQENEYKKTRDHLNKDISGFELQERMASNELSRSTKLGEDIITDAWLLSKGDYFVFVNSNVSTAVSYLNPNIKMVYAKDES